MQIVCHRTSSIAVMPVDKLNLESTSHVGVGQGDVLRWMDPFVKKINKLLTTITMISLF